MVQGNKGAEVICVYRGTGVVQWDRCGGEIQMQKYAGDQE
jgi:hypothetical protein